MSAAAYRSRLAPLACLALPIWLVACTASQNVPDEPIDGAGIVDVGVRLDQSVVDDDDNDAVALIDVTALRPPPGAHATVHVAVVLDTSGSMDGHKIENARQAAHALIDRLDPGDRVTVVSYGDAAEVLLACHTIRADRTEAHEAIDEIEADGNTCASCGLQAAYDALTVCERAAVERVVLMSDGHANRGVTDPYSLGVMVAAARQDRGIETATIGLGRLHDEVRMASLAEAGAADYHFLHNSDYLADVLDAEVADMHATAVTHVTVTLRPGDGVTLSGTPMLGGRWSQDTLAFDLGQMAIGEQRQLAVEMVLPPGDPGRAVIADIAFSDVNGELYAISGSARLTRSNDPAEVESSIDPDVVDAFLSLRAAAAMDDALSSLQQGETADAIYKLEREQQELQNYAGAMAAPVAGTNAAVDGLLIQVRESEESLLEEERGELLLQRAVNNDRRRGRPASRESYAPSAMDLDELE